MGTNSLSVTGTATITTVNADSIGIGTTPAPFIPLHIYHATESVMRLESGASGKSSIQFVRGIEEDTLVDYRFVNDTDLFRLQYQQNPTQFGDSDSFLMDTSITKTRFYKDLQVSGKVGVNTTPHATITNDVNGTSRLTGNVGIGTSPTISGVDTFLHYL